MQIRFRALPVGHAAGSREDGKSFSSGLPFNEAADLLAADRNDASRLEVFEFPTTAPTPDGFWANLDAALFEFFRG